MNSSLRATLHAMRPLLDPSAVWYVDTDNVVRLFRDDVDEPTRRVPCCPNGAVRTAQNAYPYRVNGIARTDSRDVANYWDGCNGLGQEMELSSTELNARRYLVIEALGVPHA